MKKILCLLITVIILFSLTACNVDVLAIEDYEWKMRAVMNNDINISQDEDELVVATAGTIVLKITNPGSSNVEAIEVTIIYTIA